MRKPIEAVGWKPKPKWLVSLRRGGAADPNANNKMTRSCDSLEDGRRTAEQYFKQGWDEAWIYEKS